MSTTYYTDTGNTIHLGRRLGAGGEGIVYEIHGDRRNVAKIYIQQQPPDVHQKILAMVANPPHDPTIHGPTKHHSMAWPSSALYADRQKLQFVGFVMPFIDTKNFQSILGYFHPDSRKKALYGHFTWLHLHVTARNLASCVAAIHDRGYCIGDLNESNVLVQRSTPLTIIDCDSFQVPDTTGKIFRCRVGKREYTAPEIIDCNKYEDVDRTPETDCFALGVMIFQLLMEGFHPYSARGQLVANAPNIPDKIKLGLFPYNTSRRGVEPPEYAPTFDMLAPEIRSLFIRCFDSGHGNPSIRPSAKEWMSRLDKLANQFIACTSNCNHLYLPHMTSCPWCERLNAFGEKYHSFPSPTGIGMQFKLPDPTAQIASKQEREDFLKTYIDGCLLDGVISPDEEAYLIDQGLKIHISERETKKLIAEEIKKRGITSSLGVPRLNVDKTYFQHRDIKNGDSVDDVIEITNVGDGILTGTVASSAQWIKVQGSIAPNRKNQSQKLQVVIDTNGLPYGFSGTGTVSIKTNGGDANVSVSLSTRGFSDLTAQFRKSYVPLIAALFGFIFSFGGLSTFLVGTLFVGLVAYAFAKQFVTILLNGGIDIFKFPPALIKGAAAGVVLLTIMSHSGSGSHNQASSYSPPPVQTAAPAPAPVPAPAPAPAPAPEPPTRPSIQITTAVVAEGLDANQIPLRAAPHFPYGKKRLYYYVSFKDAIPNSTVLVFYWWYQGNQIGTFQATPTSVTGNAWNYVDYNFQPGRYEVQVEANGQRLVSTSFTVFAPVASTQDIWGQQRQQAVERQQRQAAYNQQQLENQQRAEEQRQRAVDAEEYRQRQREARRRAEEAERQQQQAAYNQRQLENQQRTNRPLTERRSFPPPSGSLRDE